MKIKTKLWIKSRKSTFYVNFDLVCNPFDISSHNNDLICHNYDLFSTMLSLFTEPIRSDVSDWSERSHLIQILVRQQMQLSRLEAVLTFAFVENVRLKFPTRVFFCTRHLIPLFVRVLKIPAMKRRQKTVIIPMLFHPILDIQNMIGNSSFTPRYLLSLRTSPAAESE